jgi:RNA ligase
MTTHVAWGSIEQLHNVVKTAEHFGVGALEYRAKVKLHGSNCAVQITPAGPIPQSRNQLLTVEQDHKGFAAWVGSCVDYWKTLAPGLVVFGEWCGPGVEKGTALSKLPSKMFCVFAVRDGEQMIYEPTALEALLPARPADIHVLPWEGAPFTIDFVSRESLERTAKDLNARVAEIESEDPWVKRTFGVAGVGEGLVLYPIGSTPFDPQYMFKAKGEAHRTAGKKAVQVDATAAASIDEFVGLVITEARLRQGLEAVGGAFEGKQTGAFIAWISADVKKESAAELEASRLTWQQVERAVQHRARKWFVAGGL